MRVRRVLKVTGGGNQTKELILIEGAASDMVRPARDEQ